MRNGFPEVSPTVKLLLDTHLPTKWVAVDRETGDVWEGTLDGGWTKASSAVIDAVVSQLRPQ